MNTFVYMVRHGESSKNVGNERTRPLTEKGRTDAYRVSDRLENEHIDVYVSSPYHRAVETLEDLAHRSKKEIVIFEELKEQMFSRELTPLTDKELLPLVEKSFQDPTYSIEGGESNLECQTRAIAILKKLLVTYQGKKIAIGTHGAVMTLMMGYFNETYDLQCLLQLTKPDIYRLEFQEMDLVGIERLWTVE